MFFCSWCSCNINLITLWVTILGSPAHELVLRSKLRWHYLCGTDLGVGVCVCVEIYSCFCLQLNNRKHCIIIALYTCNGLHVFNFPSVCRYNFHFVNIWKAAVGRIKQTDGHTLVKSPYPASVTMGALERSISRSLSSARVCTFFLWAKQVVGRVMEDLVLPPGPQTSSKSTSIFLSVHRGRSEYIGFWLFGICCITMWNCLQI